MPAPCTEPAGTLRPLVALPGVGFARQTLAAVHQGPLPKEEGREPSRSDPSVAAARRFHLTSPQPRPDKNVVAGSC